MGAVVPGVFGKTPGTGLAGVAYTSVAIRPGATERVATSIGLLLFNA
jgi:hypothetical protein